MDKMEEIWLNTKCDNHLILFFWFWSKLYINVACRLSSLDMDESFARKFHYTNCTMPALIQTNFRLSWNIIPFKWKLQLSPIIWKKNQINQSITFFSHSNLEFRCITYVHHNSPIAQKISININYTFYKVIKILLYNFVFTNCI